MKRWVKTPSNNLYSIVNFTLTIRGSNKEILISNVISQLGTCEPANLERFGAAQRSPSADHVNYADLIIVVDELCRILVLFYQSSVDLYDDQRENKIHSLKKKRYGLIPLPNDFL